MSLRREFLRSYVYARGLRSSRKIERALVEEVAFRVIAANRGADHTTIASFRRRHEAALAGLFGEVLGLCAEAGLVEVGVVAIGWDEAARERLEGPEPGLRADRA